jgi:hypothetical protein
MRKIWLISSTGVRYPTPMPCFAPGVAQSSTKRLQNLLKDFDHRPSAKEDGLITDQNSVSTNEGFLIR